MPVFLDVSDAVLACELVDSLTVQRRTEIVGNDGLSQIAVVATYNPFGVVTPAKPTDLMRLPDYDLQRKSIAIVANFAFQGDTTTGKADWVLWNGDTYQVVDVRAYQRYGQGFTQAICGLVSSQPVVP